MDHKAALRRVGLGIIGLSATLTLAVGVADAFNGPGNAGGVGSGAIATDGTNNVAVGNSSTNASTKLAVTASSTAATAYAFQVFQPGAVSIFSVRNDGTVSIPGSLTAGSFASTMGATNVSAGSFGANTGGGNYVFPAQLSVGTNLVVGSSTALTGSKLVVAVPGFDPISGAPASRVEIGASWDGANTAVSFSQGAGGSGKVGFTTNFIGGYTPAPIVEFTSYQATFNTTFGGGVIIKSAGAGFESAGTNSLTIQGTQTSPGDLIRTQNYAGTRLLSITSTGGIMFPDGTTQSTAATTASTTMAATNVSAGQFGANTGGGNYSFPGNLGIGATPAANFDLDKRGAGGSRIYADVSTANANLNIMGQTNGYYPSIHFDSNGSADADIVGYTGLYIATNGGGTIRLLPGGSNTVLTAYSTGVELVGKSTVKANASANPNYTGESQKAIDVVSYGANPIDGIRFYSQDTTSGYSGWVGSIVTGPENVGAWAAKSLRLRTPDSSGNPLETLALRNGRVGVGGQVNPSYPLDVTGDVNLTGALRASGSAGTSGYVLQTTGTGIQWVATSSLGIGGGSTIAATNVSAGAFGANTGGGNYSFPANLTLSGNAFLSNSGSNTNFNNAYFVFGGAGQNNYGIDLGYANSKYSTRLFAPSGASITFASIPPSTLPTLQSNFTTLMTIHADTGNVGIGNANNTYRLDVTGDINASGALRFGGSAGTAGYVLQSNGSSAPAWVATSTLGIGGGSTIAATNVSAGSFGANTGGGNYTFPADVTLSAGNLTTSADGKGVRVGGGYGFLVKTSAPATVLGSTGALYIQSSSSIDVQAPTRFSADFGSYIDFNGSGSNASRLKHFGGVLSGFELQSATSKILIRGAASQSANLTEWQNSAGTRLLSVSATGTIMFPDGSIQTTAAGGGTTIAANNVSSGAFGANTGGGTYTFPGTVGVGLNNPAFALDISHSMGGGLAFYPGDASGAGTNAVLSRIIARSQYAASSLSSGFSAAEIKFLTGRDGWYKGQIAFFTNGTDSTAGAAVERMRIDNNGNVGIATTTPTYKLDVAGDVNLTGALRASGSAGTNGYVLQTTGTGIQWVATSTLGLGGGGSTIAATNVSSGAFGANTGGGNYSFPANVSIGTATAENADGWNKVLDILGTGHAKFSIRTATIDARILAHDTGWWSAPGGMILGTASSHPVSIGTAGVARFTILANGNVGVATTSPSSLFTVAGDTNITGALRFGGNAGTAGYVLQSNGSSAPAWVATSTLGLGGGGSTIAATNVSAGQFGANTGGGTFSFPAATTLFQNGDVNIGSGNKVQLRFGYNGSDTYQHYIVTRHNAGASTQNAIDFYTSNGVSSGSYPTNAVHGLSINNGKIGVNGIKDPTYPVDVSGDINFTGALRVAGSPGTAGYVLKSNGTSAPSWVATSTLGLGGGGSTIAADNVSAGTFGNNTGGGNYTFPANVTLSSTSGKISGNTGLTLEETGDTYGTVRMYLQNRNGVNGAMFEQAGSVDLVDFVFKGLNNQRNIRYEARGGSGFVATPEFQIGTAGDPTLAIADSGSLFRKGNVGIGAAASTDRLEISGQSSSRTRIKLNGGSSITGLEFYSNGYSWFFDNRGTEAPATRLAFFNNAGTEVMTLVASTSVGIGTNAPSYKLDVNGTLGANGIVTSYGSNTNIGAHPTYGTSYSGFWRTGGDYALLTDNTNVYLNSPGSGGTIYFRHANSDAATLTGTTLTVGGGSGKINVGTVDPIYVINGEKFATYLPGMVGVKEEVAGTFEISCDKGSCEKTIDFANEPKGSDLWLFGKTTDIKKHLPQASVLLTPSFDGRVSYRKGDGTLTILAQPFEPAGSVEVSYRLTAPRFDAAQWGNTTTDPADGFIIND